ncbi:MAG: ABC transporter permease [Gammaproteobacteria bacterium]
MALPFDYVLLKTDLLFYLLIAAILLYAWYASRHEHLQAPWREVVRKPLGMAAAVVLGFYLAIAVLDSVHFYPALDETDSSGQTRYATEIISLFDLLAGTLREQQEKTYSAPFATHLYGKEMMEHPDGRTYRDYPRLEYGGAHLDDPGADKSADLSRRVLMGLFEGLIVWGVIIAALLLLLSRKYCRSIRDSFVLVLKGRTPVPWRVILSALGALIVLTFVCINLSKGYHIFGTDKVGVDVFYQALKSIRTGVLIGTLTTLVMLPFALVLGVMAGYFRGWIDDVIQYLYTTLSSIPGVLLIAAAALLLEVYMATHQEDFESLVLRADMRLLFLCLILGITSWTGLCRLLRGEALKLREVDYVEAARAFGVSDTTILARHLLPNVMHIVMITIVLDFSGLVLAEAVLSYINIGVDPTMESWGNMINSARFEMAREPIVWWSLASAFVFMLGLVLSANLFADAVRDAFDPRIRQEMS